MRTKILIAVLLIATPAVAGQITHPKETAKKKQRNGSSGALTGLRAGARIK